MKWTVLLVVAALVVALVLLKQIGRVDPGDVAAHLKQGAAVIDVRSPEEYNSGHLRNAVNIPLDTIETAVPQRFGDKQQVLLLHCQSGVRSAMAVRKLKAIGYPNVFNLGSLARARELADQGDGAR